jgi:hypothetical protein
MLMFSTVLCKVEAAALLEALKFPWWREGRHLRKEIKMKMLN